MPRALFALLLGLVLPDLALAAPRVAASIPPVHSLVAGVMDGVGEPTLLVPPTASAHSFALRPSEARALAQADLVFWIGPAYETFLEKPLAALARPEKLVRRSPRRWAPPMRRTRRATAPMRRPSRRGSTRSTASCAACWRRYRGVPSSSSTTPTSISTSATA
jgi:hypothetical protein